MTFDLIRQGGVALIPLGLCSVLIVAVILERIWTFSRIGTVPEELMRRIEGLLQAGKLQEALRALDTSASPYARIVVASLERKPRTQQETADILTLACDAELANATRPLPILGTIGNIAPFIGLFGTVIGIMKAFMDVSKNNAAGANVVSAGIAEALIATAIGLGVGMIAVVSNNWCNAWVEDYRLRLERFSTEWSYRLHELLGTPDAAETKEPVA